MIWQTAWGSCRMMLSISLSAESWQRSTIRFQVKKWLLKRRSINTDWRYALKSHTWSLPSESWCRVITMYLQITSTRSHRQWITSKCLWIHSTDLSSSLSLSTRTSMTNSLSRLSVLTPIYRWRLMARSSLINWNSKCFRIPGPPRELSSWDRVLR